MAALIRAGTTKRGKPAIIDANHYSYVSNGETKSTKRWRCSQRPCLSSIVTRKSSGNLVGSVLPVHSHGNQLLRKQAKETERKVISKYAGIHGAAPAAVLQEISSNMLGSSFPGQLSSASSSGAVRMSLWRQRQVLNPRPKLPSTHAHFMATEIPEKYIKTADGDEFLLLRDWTKEDQEKSMIVCLSGFGCDLLRSHSTWLMDGTFRSCPSPFYQVVYKISLHSLEQE